MRIHTSPCRHIITLDLNQYVQTILARYEFDQLMPAPTPMLHDRRLTKEDCPSTDAEKLAMQDYPFRSAISSLMFAIVAMRADISVFWLTRFWKSCLSTYEGELGALMEMAKTTIAARELLSSIPISWFEQNNDTPTTLLIIDAAATKQATDNPKHHSRSIHMETFLAWVRHVISEGLV